jgi:hypothetical protein
LHDKYLAIADVNERSISHRLAIYLEDEINEWLDGWHVDCEYNRDVSSPREPYTKRLDLYEMNQVCVSVDDEHATTVYPDIIVHKRGTNQNLLVIEMKKSSATRNGRFDKERKLPAYKIQLGYKYAAFVHIRVGQPIGYDWEWIEA